MQGEHFNLIKKIHAPAFQLMRVCIFTFNGELLHKFSAMNYLMFPNNICVGPNHELFICDNRDHCIKVFNYEGEYLRRIGGEGITNYPISVSVDQFGHVMVVDNHNKFNLTIFDQVSLNPLNYSLQLFIIVLDWRNRQCI